MSPTRFRVAPTKSSPLEGKALPLTGWECALQHTIVVHCSDETQMARLQQRDNVNAQEARLVQCVRRQDVVVCVCQCA